MSHETDTIAAIATPVGVGGIGVVRVSGPAAERIARSIFRPSGKHEFLESHRLYHGDVVSPGTDIVLDECLAAFLRAPHSYTGEDSLEISCHGGPVVLESVLRAAISAGARPAGAGEFTRRAFLNNRIDLAQAEAVAELIHARTERGVRYALSQLKGALSEEIERQMSVVLDALALVEAELDFSDEEADLSPRNELRERMAACAGNLSRLAETSRQGRAFSAGIRVVIAGRPNVGKSSLLNRLAGEYRAIVTPVAGTTRDFIEHAVTIDGIPAILTDTAGIREPRDEIEREGIGFVRDRIASADLVIALLDGSEELASADVEILRTCLQQPAVVAVNKSDLPRRLDAAALRAVIAATPCLWISARTGAGIEALGKAVRAATLADADDPRAEIVVTNLRHKLALETAAAFLLQAADGIRRKVSPELIAQDLRDALTSLEDIMGATSPDEVLDRIFSRFCIGK
ncbi:MAG: tRNA modification GTPase MnmE [Syntrophaceae bacterium PtaU1.Bin231]|nr:MAG: tRNA modification GTPase MnmE [Syntrophaceae bacterium PtaU1.Bin231]HOG17993.1 tRNA uridine-5-carboxymethylaminomethyl(34) synthesis GTPase MnmE [Syntrophales bacterium]